ncbi:MAG: GerAB/ArcD/ProY family transporter [Clostridia bacterium]|nr:GerAB/ArcD/ProY family transporter [Clostridia bacterium]
MNSSFEEKNLIKVRQICFIYLAFTPVIKLLTMPSYIAEVSFEGLLLSFLIGCAVDALLLIIILNLSSGQRNATLYNDFNKNYGSIPTKIIFLILTVYYIARSVYPIFEHKLYVETTLYEMMPERITFYVFFIFSTFLSLKGLKILGRSADIAVWLTLVGLALALSLSVGSADYSNLLPLIPRDLAPVLKGAFRSGVWGFDSLYMPLMLGHFRAEKAYKTKITLSFIGGNLLVALVIATFYGIYGAVASGQNFALADMSVFSVIVTNIGRFDFVSVFLLLFAQIFAIAMPLQFATKSLERVLQTKNSTIPAVIVNGLLLLATAFFGRQTYNTLSLSVSVGVYAFIAVSAIMLGAMLFIKRNNRNEVFEK